MSSNKNDKGSSSSNPNANIRPRILHRREVLNTRPAIRPRPMSPLLRPVRPPPPPSPQFQGLSGYGTHYSAFVPYTPNQGMAIVPHRPSIQGPSGFGTQSSAIVPYTPNQEMALVPGGGSAAGPLVAHSSAFRPYNSETVPSVHVGGAEGGSEAGALVVYTPDTATGLHEGSSNAGALVVHSSAFRPYTPDTVPGKNVGEAEGGSEAGSLVVYNPDMVPGKHVGRSEGGSRSGASVVYTGSASEQTCSEKKVVASGSGTGHGSEEDNRKNCSICGKGFASQKAVFGHMRLHRNRGWRGAHPPPVFNAAEEFADVAGLNLPLVIREEVVVPEEDRAADEAAVAERAAAVEAEEAERALVVERRRGIRIDLNVHLWEQAPDAAPDS